MAILTVNIIYIADQYKKGNISKDDAMKIMVYDAMVQMLFD